MAASGQLNLGMRCIKYLLCAINSLFVLTGVMIVSVGTTIIAVYNDFSHFLHPSYESPATILIIVGVLVFVISFFGCCGAFKESTCMVLVFAVSLSVVLVMELAAAIIAYALQDNIIDAMQANFLIAINEYPKNGAYKDAMDYLQGGLKCCGLFSSEDWRGILSNDIEKLVLPDSCCDIISINKFNEYECNPFIQGCHDRLGIIVNRSALYIGTAALAITLVQLTGIMFAVVLGRAIRRQKTERERRRWELRENLINGYQPIGKSDPLAAFPVVYMQPHIDAEKPSIMS